jgi:hypothetical protein
MRNSGVIGLLAALALAPTAQPLVAQASAPAARHAAATVSLDEVTLVKASDTTAVIRSRAGALETVKVADVIGTTRAVVIEISAGQLVLDEIFTGKDGKTNRAQIVIKEGERGGTRYVQRDDDTRVSGTKPLVVVPAPGAKPAPKKPPQL